MSRYGVKNGHAKDVFERDWTLCSKYAIHSRLKSQYNWGGATWPFNEHECLHFGKKMSSKNYTKESGYDCNELDLLTTHTNRLFHILGEVG